MKNLKPEKNFILYFVVGTYICRVKISFLVKFVESYQLNLMTPGIKWVLLINLLIYLGRIKVQN